MRAAITINLAENAVKEIKEMAKEADSELASLRRELSDLLSPCNPGDDTKATYMIEHTMPDLEKINWGLAAHNNISQSHRILLMTRITNELHQSIEREHRDLVTATNQLTNFATRAGLQAPDLP